MTDSAKVAVSVRLAPALARKLRAAAIQRGCSVTSLVEAACERADWAAAAIPEGLGLSCAVYHGGRPCPGYHGDEYPPGISPAADLLNKVNKPL